MNQTSSSKLYRNLCEAVVNAVSQIFLEAKYADKVIEKVLKSDARWGARDRKFVAETVYDIVRWWRLLSAVVKVDNPNPVVIWKVLAAWCIQRQIELPPWEEFRTIDVEAVKRRFEDYSSVRKIAASIPDWLDEMGEASLSDHWASELEALNEQAKVVLRTNTLKTNTSDLRNTLLLQHTETDTDSRFADALILKQRQNVFKLKAFHDGLFEVQDAGSQLIAPYLDVEPGMRVIDACAGGGGKSLHLAALMNNKGRLISMDVEQWKLDELKKRARRAGAGNIETRLIESMKSIKRLYDSADRLLLDVPCSGLGVLRRNPDAKWKLLPEFITQVKQTQADILLGYAPMVRKGGTLVYATCSILKDENQDQVYSFIAKSGGKYQLVKDRQMMPSEGFDGFYMAAIKRID